MVIGLIGLGRMGSNMVTRLRNDNHEIVAFDLQEKNRAEAKKQGARPADSLETLVQQLSPPRNIWIMVPHGNPTSQTIAKLLTLLQPDDLVIDGGNSYFKDSIRHAENCHAKQVKFLDIGVSGGVWGLTIGYNLMVGGKRDSFARVEPVLKTLAPENGYALVGDHGAGHFVKMLHNALEYAMLQSMGETFECLKQSEFQINLQQVADLWAHGSVVRCWLLELLAEAFRQEGNDLARIADYVEDSDTGRWTAHYAIDHAIPLPTITQSLYERFASRQDLRFSNQVIAALRNQFGGHVVKRSPEE
jgi:6-phosphogluconate dehydrogenase